MQQQPRYVNRGGLLTFQKYSYIVNNPYRANGLPIGQPHRMAADAIIIIIYNRYA